MMCDSNNIDRLWSRTIDETEGKFSKELAASRSSDERPALRLLAHAFHSDIKLIEKEL